MREIGVGASGRTVGEFNPHSKLTFAKVEELRALRNKHGLTFKELGDRFGVTATTACKAFHGKNAWNSPVVRMVGQAEPGDAAIVAAEYKGDNGCLEISRKLKVTQPSVYRLMRQAGLQGVSLTTVNAAKTHCKHGHPLSGENLYIRTDGDRSCRQCASDANKRRRAKNKLKD